MKVAILAVAALALAGTAGAKDSAGQQNLQIRLTESAPNRTTDSMEYVHQNAPEDAFKEMVFVDRQIVAEQGQIKSAQAVPLEDGHARVDIYLAGARDRSMRGSVGRHVAVIIGGEVRGVGKIAPESTSDKLELNGDLTINDARALAEKINQAEARR